MKTLDSFFDGDAVRWREVTDEFFSHVHYVRHDYTILAYDAAAGTLDMLIRWDWDEQRSYLESLTVEFRPGQLRQIPHQLRREAADRSA